MNWLKNMKISTKLISAFVIVTLMAVAMGAYGIINMQHVRDDYDDLYVNFGISLGDLGSVGIDFNDSRVKVTNMLLTSDAESKKQLDNDVQELDREIDTNLVKFENSLVFEDAIQAFETLKKSLEQYRTIREQVIDLTLSGRNDEATTLLLSDGTRLAREQKDT